MNEFEHVIHPVYADLLQERFSRYSTAAWWPTPRAHADTQAMQYMRRLDLEVDDEDDHEEATTP